MQPASTRVESPLSLSQAIAMRVGTLLSPFEPSGLSQTSLATRCVCVSLGRAIPPNAGHPFLLYAPGFTGRYSVVMLMIADL